MKDNQLIRDATIYVGDYSMSWTKMVSKILDETCYELDSGKSIWLETNTHDLQRCSKTRFGQGCFIEYIEFDYLEIQVIKE